MLGELVEVALLGAWSWMSCLGASESRGELSRGAEVGEEREGGHLDIGNDRWVNSGAEIMKHVDDHFSSR